ncbi:C40 family peptidase [Hymenobacter taeanensis]|uniref:C40 family peptidase n=1 Tax=Hymenobacter taeanensis TaxID=2735321 RepID=A0A6M6BKD1_9BACT|nr:MULTISPECIES: C40 family peptidase [Hymenobacter]QJX48507.1 C40 family peptidase [Hymenobacter taeanensis]UOQ81996.1 C40 family peptidase [Hymenobacter sp. 5414T-23]
MRYIWLVFLTLAGVLLGRLAWVHLRPAAVPVATGTSVPAATPVQRVAYVVSSKRVPVRADSIVAFAMRQLGTNYCYAGSTPATGFDCSGFVNYVFARYKVPVPHSTALLINIGRSVPRQEARRGDIVVFTGTASNSTSPGHAGIVISDPGQPLRFVHSSSARRESGVKVSQVEGTDYERRFMQVRRVL